MSEDNTKACYCRKCVNYLRTQGYKIFVGDVILEYDEAIENNKRCDWCDEFDDLYEVRF